MQYLSVCERDVILCANVSRWDVSHTRLPFFANTRSAMGTWHVMIGYYLQIFFLEDGVCLSLSRLHGILDNQVKSNDRSLSGKFCLQLQADYI